MFRIDGGGNIRRIKRRPANWEQLESRDDHRFIPERRAWDAEECELIARAIGLYDFSSDERWLKSLAREFCLTRRLNLVVEPAINEWPLNRLAERWLAEAKEPIADYLPYLVQLLWVGFDRGLPVPGRGNKYRWELELASGELLSPKLDQVLVMRWFVNNPEGEDEAVQSDML